jgi:GT2 family glycosyltransferase
VPFLPVPPFDGFGEALRLFLKSLSGAAAVKVLPSGPSPSELSAARRALGASVAVLRDGVSFADSIAHEAGSGCRALVVVDHPLTRTALKELAKRKGLPPLVFVRLAGAPEEPAAPVEGKLEGWYVGGGHRRDDGVLPARAFSAPAASPAWLRERLAGLGRPAAPKIALTTIVIPCWNGLRYTKDCLASVKRWTPEPHEIVLVDNGSTDGTARYARSLGWKNLSVIRNEENLGFARAINQGISRARGRYVVWLNSDAVAAPGWLTRMIACVERAPWVGAVGPSTNNIRGLQESGRQPRLDQLPHFAEAWGMSHAGRARRAHRLTGFCFLHKREVVERIGLLDERFKLGCYEDFDYCLRLRQAGYELLLAEDSFVFHHGSKTFEGNNVAVSKTAAENREVFIAKWCRASLSFLDDVDPIIAPSFKSKRRS